MAIVRSLLSALPLDVKENSIRYAANIMAEEKQIESDVQLLASYSTDYKKRFKDLADLMIKYVLENNQSTEQPCMLDMSDMKDRIHIIQTRISNSACKISQLKIEIAEIKQSYQNQIITDAIIEIRHSSEMKEIICPICICIGPPVIPNLPCYLISNQANRQPKCSMMMCAQCFNDTTQQPEIAHLSSKCHQCYTCYDSHTRGNTTCVPNMMVMRIIDSYLSSEINEFINFFNTSFNPICCRKCAMTFSGLSDLYSHINQSTFNSSCQLSNNTSSN